LVWGWSTEEAAGRLGIDYEQARLQLAQLQDELERLAGLESIVRRCIQCGQVTLQLQRGMCLLCARGRPCCVCGTVEVLHLSLCRLCYPEHTHPCDGCQRMTRIRPGGLCSRCAREEQQARQAALMADA
jgi:hypothetical protein